MSDMVCVLAGGLGTRLRALYDDRPKALVPLRGIPFMNHQVGGLKRQGFVRVHIAGGYRADQLRAWAASNPVPGVAISVSVESEPLGTAGGILFARTFLDDNESFLIMNGDSLLPHADLRHLRTALEDNPSLGCTLTAVEMNERGQYGTIDIDSNDRVAAFREKSTNDRGWVNGGIYCMRQSVIDLIPSGVPCSLEKDIFPALAAAGKLGAVRTRGPLLDIGTPEGLERTTTYLAGIEGTKEGPS